MNWLSNIEKYSLGTFCSGVAQYGLRDFQAQEIVSKGAYWVAKGFVVNYFSIKALSHGDIKSGLIKGAIGTIFIANGILQLYSLVSEANEWQCAIWPKSLGENQGVFIQPCNAFECRPPLPMNFRCISEEQCYPPAFTPITLMTHIKCTWTTEMRDATGFNDVYELRKAISP